MFKHHIYAIILCKLQANLISFSYKNVHLIKAGNRRRKNNISDLICFTAVYIVNVSFTAWHFPWCSFFLLTASFIQQVEQTNSNEKDVMFSSHTRIIYPPLVYCYVRKFENEKDNKTIHCETTYILNYCRKYWYESVNMKRFNEQTEACSFFTYDECVNSYIRFVYNWIYLKNNILIFSFDKWYSDRLIQRCIIKSIINIQECHFLFIHPSFLCKTAVIYVSTSNEWIHHWHNMQLSYWMHIYLYKSQSLIEYLWHIDVH